MKCTKSYKNQANGAPKAIRTKLMCLTNPIVNRDKDIVSIGFQEGMQIATKLWNICVLPYAIHQNL